MESPVRSWAGSRKSSRPFRIWANFELIVSWFYMSIAYLEEEEEEGGDDDDDSAGKDENKI